jgi:hypothetical protein
MASKESDKSPNPAGTSLGNTQSAAVPRAVSKSVDRAAKAGGGRTRAQNSTPWKYYSTLIGIGVVGIGLIAQSWLATREDTKAPYLGTQERSTKEFKMLSEAQVKYKKNPKSAALKAAEKRYADYTENSHIHAAYGIYDCTKDKGKEWLLPINGEDDEDPKGIHAHADGLLHVHPFSKNVTGRRATIGRWFEATGVKVSGKEIFLPAKGASAQSPTVVAAKQQTLKAGPKCKNGKPSVIHVFEYKDVIKKGVVEKGIVGKRALGQAKDVPIKSGYAYVFARVDKDFVPPTPPSAEALVAPSDQVTAKGDGTEPTPVPVPAPTTVKGSTAPTTVKGSAATTVKPAADTTVKAADTTVKAADTTVA